MLIGAVLFRTGESIRHSPIKLTRAPPLRPLSSVALLPNTRSAQGIGSLSATPLKHLNLGRNQLKSLPPELGKVLHTQLLYFVCSLGIHITFSPYYFLPTSRYEASYALRGLLNKFLASWFSVSRATRAIQDASRYLADPVTILLIPTVVGR